MRTVAVLHLPQAGGPAQHVRPWLAALRARGPVEVVTPAGGTAAALYEDFDRVDVLSYSTLTAGAGPRDRALLFGRLLRDVARFRRHFRARRPDLVVVVTSVVPAALVAARLERIATAVYAAEIFDKGFARSRARSSGARALVRLVETLSSAIVCCSETVADQFSSDRAAHLHTIYPGVDGSFSGGDGGAFRELHQLDGAEPLLAVVGNISRGRGQDVLIRSLPELRAKLPRAHCVVVGEPHPRRVDLAYRQELTRLVRELRLDSAVTFTGFTDRVADVYGAADIVVNPARFNEPFGRVAIEALSAGRPVVSTRVGAVPEVLEDGRDAVLVAPDDPAQLAAAVIQLWNDPERLTEIAAEGRRTVARRFRLDESVERFQTVVSEVMGER